MSRCKKYAFIFACVCLFCLSIVFYGALGLGVSYGLMAMGFPSGNFDKLLAVVFLGLMPSAHIQFRLNWISVTEFFDEMALSAAAAWLLYHRGHGDVAILIGGFFVLGFLLKPIMPAGVRDTLNFGEVVVRKFKRRKDKSE